MSRADATRHSIAARGQAPSSGAEGQPYAGGQAPSSGAEGQARASDATADPADDGPPARWVERYRPYEARDVMGQPVAVEAALALAALARRMGGAPPPLLLSGRAGTGKTSLAHVFARAWGGPDVRVLELSAASERRVADIRRLVAPMCEALPGETAARDACGPNAAPARLVAVEEAETLTAPAWAALEHLIDAAAYARCAVCFVVLTNEPHRVPEALHSRLLHLRFAPLAAPVVEARLLKVAAAERLALAPAALLALRTYARGDLRCALNALHAVSIAARAHKRRAEAASPHSPHVPGPAASDHTDDHTRDSSGSSSSGGGSGSSGSCDVAVAAMARSAGDARAPLAIDAPLVRATLGLPPTGVVARLRAGLLSEPLEVAYPQFESRVREARLSPAQLVSGLAALELAAARPDAAVGSAASREALARAQFALLEALANTEMRLQAQGNVALHLAPLVGAYRVYAAKPEAAERSSGGPR